MNRDSRFYGSGDGVKCTGNQYFSTLKEILKAPFLQTDNRMRVYMPSTIISALLFNFLLRDVTDVSSCIGCVNRYDANWARIRLYIKRVNRFEIFGCSESSIDHFEFIRSWQSLHPSELWISFRATLQSRCRSSHHSRVLRTDNCQLEICSLMV